MVAKRDENPFGKSPNDDDYDELRDRYDGNVAWYENAKRAEAAKPSCPKCGSRNTELSYHMCDAEPYPFKGILYECWEKDCGHMFEHRRRKFAIKFVEVIGTNYLRRYRLLPLIEWKKDDEVKQFYFPANIFLHKFTSSDIDRALHDHPWPSVSILLSGELWEIYESEIEGLGEIARFVKPFRFIFRKATHKHRLILKSDVAWTIFAVGFKQRSWGFWPDGKFVPWRKYLGLSEDATID